MDESRVPNPRALTAYVVLVSALTSLAWLINPLYVLATASHVDPGRLTVASVGTALILVPYPFVLWRALMYGSHRTDQVLLGAMLAISVVMVLWLGGDWVMTLAAPAALFAAVWTPGTWPSVGLAAALSAVLFGYGLTRDWSPLRTSFDGVYLAGVAFSGSMIVWFCQVVEELRRTRAELAGRAVGEERQRFARDLHDVLGHSLQAVALRAELAERMIDRDPGRVAKELVEIQEIARGAVQDVREVVRGYRATSLRTELQGMTAVLHAAGIRCETPPVAPDLPRHVHETLGWVAREAVTNVLRHSTAGWVRLEITPAGGRVRLEITNDGAGSSTGRDQGSGLAGLAERISAAGGVFQAGPAGEGTFRVVADVPTVEVAG